MDEEEVSTEAPEAPPPAVVRTDEPGHVAVVGQDGEVKSIPAANAARAAELGYRPASKAEYEAARDGLAGSIKAGLYGAARGVSFGVFDPLAVAASEAVYGPEGGQLAREELRLAKEGHETATLVGEIGGSLAPLAFGAPPGGAAVEGSSLLARAGARAVAALPRAAMEGAAIGLGQQLSEDTLGNHDLVAQKYVAAALKGGALGALLGAGLHASGGFVADKLAARAAASAERAGVRAESRVGSRLADLAEEQAAKGLMPSATLSAAELQKLGRTAAEQQARLRRIGRTVLDEGIVSATSDKATMAERITKRVGEVGEELASLRKSLERAKVRPNAQQVLTRIRDEVVSPLAAKPFSAAEQASIKPYVEEIEKLVGKRETFASFEELHNLRVRLDKKLDPKLWNKIPGTAPAGFEELGQIRGILESEFEAAAERAAVELGENTAQKYRVVKSLFSDLKTAEKWATKGAAREAQNRAVSLTDTIAAGQGATAAVAGLVAGHPAAALGFLAGPANKALRTYGNQAAAVIAEKGARLLGVQRAAEAFDRRLTKAVKGFYTGGKGGKAAETARKPKVDPETARALRQATKNPDAMTAHVARVVQQTGLSQAAPRVAQGMTSVLIRAATYLGTRMPAEPPPVGFSFGPTKARALGPYQQAKLEAVVGALDVDGLLGDLERGRLDRQKVEALKFINPDLYDEIVKTLVRHGQEDGARLSLQQEVALSILTGQPIGAMMQPRTIQGFQAAHSSQGPAPEAAGGGETKPIGSASGGGMSRAASALRAPSDRLEADDV